MKVSAVVVLLCFAVTPCLTLATADANDRKVVAIKEAMEKWSTTHGVNKYALAIGHNGKVVGLSSKNQPTDKKRLMASLGKAITGACVLALARAGKLGLDDRVDSHLAPETTLNAPENTITIRQLLTHSSGLKPDLTQGEIPKWRNSSTNLLKEHAKAALAPGTQQGKPGEYFYNNSNYAVLGRIIEKVTAKGYEAACREQMPSIAGNPNIRISQKWKALSSFGGWEVSVEDYLAFALAEFGPDSATMQRPGEIPKIALGGGAYYGPGVLLRGDRTKGYNVWHTGLLCLDRARNNVGSFFAIWRNGWSVVVSHNKCTTYEQLIDLDRALATAAHRS